MTPADHSFFLEPAGAGPGTPVGLECGFNRQSEMTKIIVFLHKINAFGPRLSHVKPEWATP